MMIIIGLALIGSFAALLWLTQHRTPLHIAVISTAVGIPFIFGYHYGLSAGFLMAISLMAMEIAVCWKCTNGYQNV